MELENMWHISFVNTENYPFEVDKIYEFSYMDEVITSMFKGISEMSGDYLFFSKLNHVKNGIQHFVYDNVFMNSVKIVSPLSDYYKRKHIRTDIIEDDEHTFMISYREYLIDSIL
jgi:hypothetical protein